MIRDVERKSIIDFNPFRLIQRTDSTNAQINSYTRSRCGLEMLGKRSFSKTTHRVGISSV